MTSRECFVAKWGIFCANGSPILRKRIYGFSSSSLPRDAAAVNTGVAATISVKSDYSTRERIIDSFAGRVCDRLRSIVYIFFFFANVNSAIASPYNRDARRTFSEIKI